MPARTVLFFVVLNLLLSGGAHGQEATVRVTAQAEPMTVTVGSAVVLTVRVEGVPATVVRTPKRPATVNLEPRQQYPDTRRTRSPQDGTIQRALTYSWRFRARRAGTARIQPVTVVIQGKEYSTSPIQVQVTSPSAGTSGPTLEYPDSAARASLDERDLFVQATATTDRAYQNEQVVVDYRLFYRPGIRLRHSRLADSWDAPGFWREELNVASRPTPQMQRAYGQRYETVVLKRVSLFPTRPGTLRVDPLRIETEAQGTVRMQQGGPALRGRFQPVQLASQRLSVQVRPLPAAAPGSFDGTVGQFSMSTRVEADSAAVGDPVSLTVQIEGRGNLTTLSPPRLDSVPGLVAYEPTVEADLVRNGPQLRGSKTFTYTLVPQAGGRHTTPAVRFSYFNPEAGQYETLRSQGTPLQVMGTAAAQAVGRTGDGLPVGNVTGLMAADEAHWVRTARRPLYRQPWVYLSLLVPILLAGGVVVYRRRKSPGATTDRASQAAASSPTAARLQAARRRLEDGDGAAFYDTLKRELRSALADRLELDSTPRTRADLDRHLQRHDVPPTLRDRVSKLLDRCDERRYAPSAGSGTGERELLDEAEALLRQLDSHRVSTDGSLTAR